MEDSFDEKYERKSFSLSLTPLTGVCGAQVDPGEWETATMDLLEVAPRHAILLPPVTGYPNGLVLYFGGHTMTEGIWRWDPTTTVRDTVDQSPSAGVNLHCTGHSFLADGSVVFAGGTYSNLFYNCGVAQVTVYDPFADTMTDAGDMDEARWYPTNVTDIDGTVYFFSGNKDNTMDCDDRNRRVERFDPDAPGDTIVTLYTLPTTEPEPSLYPRMHLMSHGEMAIVGTGPLTRWYDIFNEQIYDDDLETNLGLARGSSNSVLLPIDLSNPVERVLLIGGYANGQPEATCEILALNAQGNWAWSYTNGDQNEARAHADAVLLLDGQVFLVGGGESGNEGCPILNPELFNPATEQWTWLTGAPHDHPRMYHSIALLLLDGSVMVAGQDEDSTCPGQDPIDHGGDIVEIYYPWYYDEARPSLDSVPSSVIDRGGAAFEVEFTLPSGRTFDRVALVALSAVKHSVNMTQRYLILESVESGGVAEVTPPSADFAPPGPYMLTVIDSAGVPSIAKVVYFD